MPQIRINESETTQEEIEEEHDHASQCDCEFEGSDGDTSEYSAMPSERTDSSESFTRSAEVCKGPVITRYRKLACDEYDMLLVQPPSSEPLMSLVTKLAQLGSMSRNPAVNKFWNANGAFIIQEAQNNRDHKFLGALVRYAQNGIETLASFLKGYEIGLAKGKSETLDNAIKLMNSTADIMKNNAEKMTDELHSYRLQHNEFKDQIGNASEKFAEAVSRLEALQLTMAERLAMPQPPSLFKAPGPMTSCPPRIETAKPPDTLDPKTECESPGSPTGKISFNTVKVISRDGTYSGPFGEICIYKGTLTSLVAKDPGIQALQPLVGRKLVVVSFILSKDMTYMKKKCIEDPTWLHPLLKTPITEEIKDKILAQLTPMPFKMYQWREHVATDDELPTFRRIE